LILDQFSSKRIKKPIGRLSDFGAFHSHIFIAMQELDDFIDDQDDEILINLIINWSNVW
tara:strand:- start:95 stop:271 length:177 start_codon:yes stop_codon:yes gene_type:complete